jgi:hypothetical protein
VIVVVKNGDDGGKDTSLCILPKLKKKNAIRDTEKRKKCERLTVEEAEKKKQSC